MGQREGYRWRKRAWHPSAAQRRVLDGLTAGQTNAEIGRRLGLSPATVTWHVRELLAETGSADRHALANWWRTEQDGPRGFLPLFLPAASLARAALIAAAGGVLVAGALGARQGGVSISPLAARTSPIPIPPTSAPETASPTFPPRTRLTGTLQQVVGDVLVLDTGAGPARAVVGPETAIVLVSVGRGVAVVQPGDAVRLARGYRASAGGYSIPWDPYPYTTTTPVVLLPEYLAGAVSLTDAERCRWEGLVRGRAEHELHLATTQCGDQIIPIDPRAPLTRQQSLPANCPPAST